MSIVRRGLVFALARLFDAVGPRRAPLVGAALGVVVQTLVLVRWPRLLLPALLLYGAIALWRLVSIRPPNLRAAALVLALMGLQLWPPARLPSIVLLTLNDLRVIATRWRFALRL